MITVASRSLGKTTLPGTDRTTAYDGIRTTFAGWGPRI